MTLRLQLLAGLVFGLWLTGSNLYGQDTDDSVIERSAKRAEQRQLWKLQYRMQPQEILRWEVEQIATTDATMAGFSEKTSLRTRSVIAWEILSVDTNGNMTIQDQLESAVEWQRIGESAPISFDSSKDEEVPDVYQATAEKIGKPISTTTINPSGQIIQQENHIRRAEFGMGKFTLPLPEQAIPMGGQWNTPENLQARRGDGTLKVIKTRMLYTLRKVENGIATISFRREILTPVEDPKIKSQIQQKMNQGALFFDIAKGRTTKKVVQWDEKVQGFEGDDSYLHYVGKYTMELLETPQDTAATVPGQTLQPLKQPSVKNASRSVGPRNGKPIIRK